MEVDPLALVDATAVEWLLDRSFAFDDDPAGWPRSAPTGGSEATAQLGQRLTGLLDKAPGYALVDLGAHLNDELLCRATWNLFTTLCLPVPQYATGEMFFPVEAAEAQPAHSPFSMSRSEVEMHNDGTFLPAAPQVAALLSLAAADQGGETIIVDGADVFGELTDADAAVLLDHHPIDLRGQTDGPPIRSQAIATRDARGRLRLRYVRSYIEAGYAKAGRQIPAATRTALDHVDALAADEARQIAFLLKRGELLLVDNQRFLHGRRAFREAGTQRRLRRVYGMLR